MKKPIKVGRISKICLDALITRGYIVIITGGRK